MKKHTYYMEENMKSKKDKKLHAWTAKVGTKGQIVIPKEAREIFSIETGDNLLILGDDSKWRFSNKNFDEYSRRFKR